MTRTIAVLIIIIALWLFWLGIWTVTKIIDETLGEDDED